MNHRSSNRNKSGGAVETEDIPEISNFAQRKNPSLRYLQILCLRQGPPSSFRQTRIAAQLEVGFSYNPVTPPAPKCSSSNRYRSKLAAKSRNTLELKTEEWVSG